MMYSPNILTCLRILLLGLSLLVAIPIGNAASDSGHLKDGNNGEGSFIASSYGYQSPLEIPLYLSGTFGELRGSHFHSGMDIRTQGKSGLKVMSIADGYVSRIKVSPWGFGKALYIDHPTGHTSVYAHLQNFNSEIEEYIRSIQYSSQSYAVDEYLGPNKLPVKQSEVIGISGNSGGSQGPHLHFEVRNTKSQIPTNPLAYGFDVKDNIPPYYQQLKIYYTEYGNGKFRHNSYTTHKRGVGNYRLYKDTISVSERELAFGVEVYDQMENSGSRNGIHELNLKVDGKTIYHFDMDQFSFSETRYIQAHTDYAAKVQDNDNVHRLYQLPGNRLSIYDTVVSHGVVSLADNDHHLVEITIADYQDNISTLTFVIRYEELKGAALNEKIEYDRFYDHRKEQVFSSEELRVYFPARSFYDNVYFKYKVESPVAEESCYSSVHHLHDDTEPLHNNFTVSILPKNLPDPLMDKAVIVLKDRGGDLSAKNSYWTEDKLTARSREFGKYYITIDTVPPHIAPVNLYQGKDLSKHTKIQFQVRDVLSGLDECKVYVDGEWILMEYDAKYDLFTYFFDHKVKPGERFLVVKAKDNVGNESDYSLKFKR